jgi:hypothetical protein
MSFKVSLPEPVPLKWAFEREKGKRDAGLGLCICMSPRVGVPGCFRMLLLEQDGKKQERTTPDVWHRQ